jgi:hypothetical protein
MQIFDLPIRQLIRLHADIGAGEVSRSFCTVSYVSTAAQWLRERREMPVSFPED